MLLDRHLDYVLNYKFKVAEYTPREEEESEDMAEQ